MATKITPNDLMQNTQGIGQAIPKVQPNTPVGQVTGQMDGWLEIVKRADQLLRSPSIQKVIEQIGKRMEIQNGQMGNQTQTLPTYENPQAWDNTPTPQPKPQQGATQMQQQPQQEKPQLTNEQMKKYFKTEDELIKFIEELLKIIPEEMTTQEVSILINSYVGQLPNQQIKQLKPLFEALKGQMKNELKKNIYGEAEKQPQGGKGAEKGEVTNANTENNTERNTKNN